MNPDEPDSQQPDKPLNYWQADPNEQPVQYAPEAPRDVPVAEPTNDPVLKDEDTVNWEAVEYIHMEKGALWFVALAVIALALIAVDIFLFKSGTFTVLVIIMVIALMVYIRRPPRTLHYALSPRQGLYVGDKLYTYDQFKSFGMIRDGEHFSIILIPTKRFALEVSVYFPEEAGERIIDILGQRLPMEDHKLNSIDILVRKLRL